MAGSAAALEEGEAKDATVQLGGAAGPSGALERHPSKPVSRFEAWAKVYLRACVLASLCIWGWKQAERIRVCDRLHPRMYTQEEDEAADGTLVAPAANGDAAAATAAPPTTFTDPDSKPPPLPLLARPFSRPNLALTIGNLVYGLVSTFFRVPIGYVRTPAYVYFFPQTAGVGCERGHHPLTTQIINTHQM